MLIRSQLLLSSPRRQAMGASAHGGGWGDSVHGGQGQGDGGCVSYRDFESGATFWVQSSAEFIMGGPPRLRHTGLLNAGEPAGEDRMLLTATPPQRGSIKKPVQLHLDGDGWGNSHLGNGFGGSSESADMSHIFDHWPENHLRHYGCPITHSFSTDFPTMVFFARLANLLETRC